jgi:hypothetical protein
MKTIARVLIMPGLLLALAGLQTNLAAQTSGCTNGPNTSDGTDYYVQFTCNLYPSATATTIDLIPNLTYDGALSPNPNSLGAGYTVVINGDPTLLSDDDYGLWNQSLWDAVLYWPGDLYAGYGSDSLTVYYAGNSGFPSVSTVEDFDQSLYGAGPDYDPYFFVQSGNPAVYAPGNDTYNVYPVSVPEPASVLFLGLCLPVLAVGFVVKVKTSRSVLHA